MIEMTKYYDEYIRYYDMALDQQIKCNTAKEAPYGMIEHADSGMNDDLMEKVTLYDVVERKLAGFSQIVNDCFYGWTSDHPYWPKMQAGKHTHQRATVAQAWTGKHADFGLPEWLYVFILHRVCGSAINYATQPSGYHNTILFSLHQARTIEDMAKMVTTYPFPFYTSVGYQFPAFPKPPADSNYKRGGDYFLAEFAPRLARELADWLCETGQKKDLREIGEWMFEWNRKNGLRVYQFQYAAVLADIADWYPQYVNLDSMFYYGTNARECISYLAIPTKKMSHDQYLDKVMDRIYLDTKSVPYNAEDVCCDFIRWVENYIRPGAHYDSLDFDTVFSSCKITDHPFGRQKAMLDLGLVKTFNGMKAHPSDDKIIKEAGLTIEEYKRLVKGISNVSQ
jgi:hypothetical protein